MRLGILDILSMEEEKANFLAFVCGMLATIGAFIVVVGFWEGSLRDSAVLIMTLICILIRISEKRIRWFQPYAKYAYMTMPFWATCLLIISNDGKFAAVTQFYFMWLMLSIAYCDTKLVLFCSFVTIASTAGAIIYFPEAMLKLDNMAIWFYIFTIYYIATLMAVIVTRWLRNLIEQTEQLKMYENELIYLEQLEKREEKKSEFIHNIKHYFIAIGEMARVENCGQILDLLQELNLDLQHNERIIYTNHKVVNAVLTQKTREASENDIDFDIYVEPGIQFGEVSNSDLVAMLGNLLDNALEAAKNCTGEKRKVIVRIFMEKEGKVCVVKLVNYYAVKPRAHKSGFMTSKKEPGLHGIGIKSVDNTIKKYRGGVLQCLVDEECFTAILIIPTLQCSYSSKND